MKDKNMKQLKNIKKFKTKEQCQKISKFSPILMWKLLYNFSRLTPKQKLYLIKTMENIRKYNL
jgi:hypothetical protein